MITRTVTEHEIHDVKVGDLDDFLTFCTLENIEPLNIRFKHIAGMVNSVIITVKYPVGCDVQQLPLKYNKFMNIGEVPADHFVELIHQNVDNEKLTDTDFREFVRNTLPIVKRKSKRGKK